MLEHFLNNPATGVISPQIATASKKTAHHQVQVDAKNLSPKTLLQIANLPSVQRLVTYGAADDLAEFNVHIVRKRDYYFPYPISLVTYTPSK